MSTRWLLILGLACAWGAWQSWKYREFEQAPGVLVDAAPSQQPLAEAAPAIAVGEFELQPRATYDITARLLARRRYWWDAESALARLDFAVGWGAMSDSGLLDQLRLRQSHRFFHVTWPAQPPIDTAELFSSAANMHLIPADPSVERALDRMRPGQLIRLRGRLVDARRADGWFWPTSLSREDLGAGACELMWVDAAQTLS